MNDNDFITVAKVLKPQGRVGEVLVQLFTDFPEKFEERRKLYAWLANGERREVALEEFWPHKGTLVLKFGGIDSIDDAEQLKGAEIQIPREQRSELADGVVYVSELSGCEVIASTGEGDPQSIGTVADVDFGAGEAPLLVIRNGKREFLVPFVETFVTKQDLGNKRIEMRLPEGLLELDAPLSRDEKEAAHRGDREDG